MSELSLQNISFQYREGGRTVPALADVSFNVPAGQFVSIIGASGSGKSTLLQIVAGLLRPDNGQVLIDNKPQASQQKHIAYMPQQDALLPWRTVLDNVVLGPEVRGSGRQDAVKHAKSLLPLFGLDGFGYAFPAQLSGGMRQRAALLRTFLIGSDILLLDEPFGALDALTRRELQGWLLDIWAKFSHTILFVTHDVEEAIYLSDRVVVLSARPGTVVHDFPIKFLRPRQQHFDPYHADVLDLQSALLMALKGRPNANPNPNRL